jgi:TPR repeat protein
MRPPAAVPQAAAPQGVPKRAPGEAMRTGTQALREGRSDQAVTAFEYAAEQGMPDAIWKLGRMYSEGDGVDQNKLRAFEYFKNLTKSYADDPPGTRQARFVASAFVSLGHFYLEGIPDTYVKADAAVAREMFHYAASYYADPDAQYQLGLLYLNGTGAGKDPKQAARWFKSAADKGLRKAQAMLGTMLFKGQGVARQAPLGLAWLTVAKEGARADEAWISDNYKNAIAQATLDERALAGRFLEDIVKPRRR